jgi:hypothetical protein
MSQVEERNECCLISKYDSESVLNGERESERDRFNQSLNEMKVQAVRKRRIQRSKTKEIDQSRQED